MCVVEADNTDGFVLSCNTPPVEGMNVTTSSDELYKYRQNIMKLYDVNHPLQCGVCDKSGECDLQNKTLEFGVDSQTFSAKEQRRPIKNWGVISYDESLCIMCEKCVSVCNEVTGYNALEIKYGGYSSHIKRRSGATCVDCGECVSVCPVGAMHTTDFKYKANAWELEQVPASCAHCSGGCSLTYEVQNLRHYDQSEPKIVRVTADREFTSLCHAGRYGFDFANMGVSKEQTQFDKAVSALQNADTISFNSYITNEEAMILQRLKEQRGIKLYNPEAKAYQDFLKAYGSISGSYFYRGSMEMLKDSDYIMVLGSAIAVDSPDVKYTIAQAHKRKLSYISYLHPMVDVTLKNLVSQFVKYEVGSEEGVVGMIAEAVVNEEGKEKFKAFFDELDVGYLSGESNFGEEELEKLTKNLRRKKSPMLVVGADVINHPEATNIAKLVAMIERYSDFNVVVIPPRTNTMGVSLICELDDKAGSSVVGYNEAGDFVLDAHGKSGENILEMPALNQQEGTFTTIDKRVVPTNAALAFGGYELNDLANALGLEAEHTIDYTPQLPSAKGYQAINFDDLPDYFTNSGEEVRGYFLGEVKVRASGKVSDIASIDEYNGAIIYRANTVRQHNRYTHKAVQCEHKTELVGSEQFAMAAKIKSGDMVIYEQDGIKLERKFRVNHKLTGTVAMSPDFDVQTNNSNYRYEKVTIERGVNE
jgi:NADH-quinone oxidoreductase subunit G